MGKFKNYEVRVVVGLPGSGKTSTAQYLTLQALKRGENVWCNMPIAGAYKIKISDIGQFNWEVNGKQGGLLIIDEAGIAVNSRNWQSLPQNFIEFIKLHRHFKMDVYFFSQGDDIDQTIKRVAQKWYKVQRCKIPMIGKRYSVFIPVVPNLVVAGGKFVIEYRPNKLPFTRVWLPIYKTWHLFNSYEIPFLPGNNWEKWGEVYECDKFTFKKLRRILFFKWYRFFNKKIDKKIDNIFKE